MGRVVSSQAPRRRRKDAPRRARTDERNDSPRSRAASHTAEHAARELMTELKSKGYDPRTGGALFLQGSDSTDEFDKDRYQLTASKEAAKEDRYEMTPSEEAELESRDDHYYRDASYYRGDTYTEYSRKTRATDYSEASSTPNTTYTESYGGETRDDWTMLAQTVVSSGSRQDDGCTQATSDDSTRDDSTTRTEYSEATRVRPPRMRKGDSKPQVSASVASGKYSSSSGSSDSEITDKEFEKVISNSFENSVVDATFSKVVGIQEKKQQGKRSKNPIKHPPMGETLNHADKKSNLPTSTKSTPTPTTSRRVKPLGAQSTTYSRGSTTSKSEHIGSPRTATSVISRSPDVVGPSPRRPRDSGQSIEATTSKSEHIKSPRAATSVSPRSPDVVGRRARHFFPEDNGENEITEQNERNGPTCDDLAAATSAEADSINNTPSSRRDTGSLRVGLRSMFARPASPAKRDKQRSKANTVLTKDHPNPGTATTGYSNTSTTPKGGPPHANQSEPVRSRISSRPDSNTGTKITRRSLSPAKRNRTRRSLSPPKQIRTRRSLSPPKRLRSRIIISPESNAGTEITRRSLSPPKRLGILHGSASSDGSFKNLESNKVAPAKKRTLFKRFLKASSGRNLSSTKPRKPEPIKPAFALVSREKLFKELKESGINTQAHQMKAQSAGSVLGRLITPRRRKNDEESAGELTEGEWSVVSRESECFSDSECSYDDQEEAGNRRGKGQGRKMKKRLLNRMKSSPRAHGDSAARFSLPVHDKPFETTKNKETLPKRMKSSPRGRGRSAGYSTRTTDAHDKPSKNTEKRSGSRTPTEPARVNSVRLEGNDSDIFSAEGRAISSIKASRGSTVTSLKSMTSKSSKSVTSNISKSSAVSKSAQSAKSATSIRSKLSENTSIASKASHQSVANDEIDILPGLAPEENQSGRPAQLPIDTRSPLPDRQGVSSPKKQLPSPKKVISGSVRKESTGPKKLIKKLSSSSPKDKSKEESVSALNVHAPATRVGQPGAVSATRTVANAETGHKPSSRKKFMNLFKSAARKQKKSDPKSVGKKLVKETDDSVQVTVGSGSSSIDPAIDQPVDAANDSATNLTTTNAAAPASAVEAAASAWAFLNHSYAEGKASTSKSLFQAEAPEAAERDTDGNIPSENEETKEDSLQEKSFVNIDSSAPQLPTETTANSESKARTLPEVSSEAKFSSDNEKTTEVEAGNKPQQKETRMYSSSHKNQPEDVALTKSDALVSNQPAPKTRKVQTLTLAQVLACAACQDDKQNMSPQNVLKLDLEKALADADSSSTRRSQYTSENSTGTYSATAEPGLAAKMAVDGKYPVDNTGTQKQLPTGTTENTDYAACGTLGFMFHENPAADHAAPGRKGVRFSEDLEFVRVIPPDSVSITETLDSSPSFLSQENERAKGGEVFPRVTGPSSKKKGIFSWIRGDSRGRAKQLASRKSPQSIQEEEPEDMDDIDEMDDMDDMDDMEPDEGSDSAEEFNEETTAGSDDSVDPSPVQSKGDVVSNTAMEASGKDMHSRKHQRHTSPKATTKHSSKEKVIRNQAVPIGQRVAMKEGGGDGNESSMPLPPPEEEGIELIARRTKTGKNAILIAKTGNPRYDIPTRHHSIVQSEHDSSLEGKRKTQRKRPKNLGKPKQKAPLRLRFFRSNNENDVSTVTLPRKGLKSRMPQQMPRNRRNGSSRVQRHNRNGSLSTEATERDSASNSLNQDGPNTHRNGVPRLSPANHEAGQRSLKPPLARVNSETVLSPVGLRKQDHSDNLNQNSYTVASGRTDQALRDASEATGFEHGAMSVNSFGSSTHFDQGTRYTQGSDGVSATGGDWFSYLMPGIFAPIPPPKKPKKVDRSVFADDLSQETGSVFSNKIQDEQWREILDATETLAIRYKEQRDVGDDDASDRSISDESIKEVNDAITKFREHAARLGMRERELMAAVRDDDRILHSGPSRKQQKGFVSRMGNATDKFIDVFDFYFSDGKRSSKQ